MKKVTFVILENDRKRSLTALRKAGVVHLEPLAGAGDDLAALKAQLGRVERLVSLMDGVKLPKGFFPSQSVRNNLDIKEAALKTDEVLSYFDEKKALEDEIVKTTREIERFAPWGEVDPADFAYFGDSINDRFVLEKVGHAHAVNPSDELKKIALEKSWTILNFQ